ncbi:site-specific integrase [Planosporangium sp. 12N6]|uniref:site-specific integrase n=1 Tax=Planosporangium spinosum TaxID=3402278 RepID=UPI003CE792DB
MTKRRSRGDGGLHWDEARQRWIASVTVGYTPAGKRIVRRGSGKTKTEARDKLKEVLRDHEDGLVIAPQSFTVADAVTDWLTYGLNGRAKGTVDKCTHLCRSHIIPAIGARKLRELSATDVDRWLADKAEILSTRTLRELYACLNRSVNRAMARDKVKRNVVALCTIPRGQEGRPSKSLTLEQAKAVLNAAEDSKLHAYVVLSLLTGARTEELRALTWDHVDLDGQPDADPLVPPSIQVWHSVRAGGDTKTKKSRRTLALPLRCVEALRRHRERQKRDRDRAKTWHDEGIVFASSTGLALDAANVRRAFRLVTKRAGLDPADWTPRELRHSFVSVLSSSGVRIEDIADLCGHSGTTVTEKVYRHQLRPVLLNGAVAMDRIFDAEPHGSAA